MMQAKTETIVEKTHHFVHTNGITLHLVAAGPEDGPVVLLLHGYPEFWYGWRAQIPALAMAGFRVLAPDLRGYNLSDKPAGIAAYQPQVLVEDMAGIIRATGRKQVRVVGHDWGGLVAWWLALSRPELVSQAVILNAPHPTVFDRELRTNRNQQRKSWYIALFQLPSLPEAMLGANNWLSLASTLERSSRRDTFSAADLDQYRQAWSRPGAATAMMNYYRAVLRHPSPNMLSKRVQVPVQIIWGQRDTFMLPEMAEKSVEMCDDGRLLFVEKGTHWVHHEWPGRVNEALLTLL